MESHSNIPEHIKGAKFIKGRKEDDNEWPRDPSEYHITLKFRERFKEFGSIIDGDIVRRAIQEGDLYEASRDCVAFVEDMDGVSLCVVVGMGREEDSGYAPLNAVSIWPYLYDREKALNTGRWSSRELNEMEELYRDSFEDEIEEYRIYIDTH